MKIILISQFFYPEPNSPRGLEFAKELVHNGHEVVCITTFPSYPDGKIYKAYKQKLYQREFIDGIEVVRLPIYVSHTKSAIKRFFSYLSFASSLFLLLPFIVRKRFDILFSYCPPITVPFVTIYLKWYYRSKLIIDIQDFWPNTLASAGGISPTSSLYKIISKFSYFTYNNADYITVISPGFKDKLIEKGFDSNKIKVVYNWSTAKEQESKNLLQENALKKELGFDNSFIILFAGNIGQAQGLDHVLIAMKEIQKSHSDIKMYFYGSGVDRARLIKESERLGVENVFFRERVSLERINNIQQAADVLFLHLKKDPLFEITIPSKLSGYLMLGKPIIGGLEGNARNLLETSKAGMVYEPENSETLIKVIKQFHALSSVERKEMGQNGRSFYKYNISKETGVEKFQDIFQELISENNTLEKMEV